MCTEKMPPKNGLLKSILDMWKVINYIVKLNVTLYLGIIVGKKWDCREESHNIVQTAINRYISTGQWPWYTQTGGQLSCC